MVETGWDDWLAEAERALEAVQARTPDGRVVVVGLSMGGALTAALAEGHPELAGIVLINAPVAAPAELAAAIEEMLAGGMEVIDSIGGDIADPDADEASYDETPLRPLLTMIVAGQDVRARLAEIQLPTLIITSRQDHVVNPEDSRRAGRELGGPGGAHLAGEELPRRHARLRPGRGRGGHRRLRPAGHRRLSTGSATARVSPRRASRASGASRQRPTPGTPEELR